MVQDDVVGICPICRRNVYSMEPHFVNLGIDYHNPCYVKHLCIVKRKLDTKKSKGSITLDEAKELEGVDQTLIKITSDNENKDFKYSPKKYENLICKPNIREDYLRSNLNNKMKLLEEDRGQRWAFEALNMIDNIFYISAPDEKKQITEGSKDATM